MMQSTLQVAGVVLYGENNVLLVRHVNGKHIENIYGLPAGKKDILETHVEAARRELEEETGLVSTTSDLIPIPTSFFADVTFKSGEVKHCEMHVFLCKRYTGKLRRTAQEIPEWIPVSEVGTLKLLPNVQKAIEEGLKIAT